MREGKKKISEDGDTCANSRCSEKVRSRDKNHTRYLNRRIKECLIRYKIKVKKSKKRQVSQKWPLWEELLS